MQFDAAALLNTVFLGQQPPIVVIYVASVWVLLALIVASVRFKTASRFAFLAFLLLAAIILASLALLFAGASGHMK